MVTRDTNIDQDESVASLKDALFPDPDHLEENELHATLLIVYTGSNYRFRKIFEDQYFLDALRRSSQDNLNLFLFHEVPNIPMIKPDSLNRPAFQMMTVLHADPSGSLKLANALGVDAPEKLPYMAIFIRDKENQLNFAIPLLNDEDEPTKKSILKLVNNISIDIANTRGDIETLNYNLTHYKNMGKFQLCANWLTTLIKEIKLYKI
uniref:Uncharacterized protein n=1 Tax=Magnetococcus massalia (strain MO-1) TaxID=451514 RepID=A0A1S7LIE0_MAGMO|nr:protein of unknown function [Candidatus Magnetococcus massalia]